MGIQTPSSRSLRTQTSFAYAVEQHIHATHLEFRITGPESFQNALGFWQMAAVTRREVCLAKILIIDEVDGVLEPVEIFQLSKKISELLDSQTEIAYVDPKPETIGMNTFGESIVRGAGFRTKIFTGAQEALNWLLQNK